MAIRRAYVQPQQGAEGFARTRKIYGGNIPLLATDLALNAQTALLIIPKDFVLLALLGTVPDLDTGTTLTLSLGDAANNARFLSASTVGQAGGAMPALIAASVGYQFPADTEILLTAAAAATGGTAGIVTLYMDGFLI